MFLLWGARLAAAGSVDVSIPSAGQAQGCSHIFQSALLCLIDIDVIILKEILSSRVHGMRWGGEEVSIIYPKIKTIFVRFKKKKGLVNFISILCKTEIFLGEKNNLKQLKNSPSIPYPAPRCFPHGFSRCVVRKSQ